MQYGIDLNQTQYKYVRIGRQAEGDELWYENPILEFEGYVEMKGKVMRKVIGVLYDKSYFGSDCIEYTGQFNDNNSFHGKGKLKKGTMEYEGVFENGILTRGKVRNFDIGNTEYEYELTESIIVYEQNNEYDGLLHSFKVKNMDLFDYEWMVWKEGEKIMKLQRVDSYLLWDYGDGDQYKLFECPAKYINQVFVGKRPIREQINGLKEIKWDEIIVIKKLQVRISKWTEEFVISNNNWKVSWYSSQSIPWEWKTFPRLKRIEIGNECFQQVHEFVIDGLPSLESVKIGHSCFRISGKERDDGVCRITNCPNLHQLEIDSRSFEDFKSFKLFNVNSIQSIKFGDWWKVFWNRL